MTEKAKENPHKKSIQRKSLSERAKKKIAAAGLGLAIGMGSMHAQTDLQKDSKGHIKISAPIVKNRSEEKLYTDFRADTGDPKELAKLTYEHLNDNYGGKLKDLISRKRGWGMQFIIELPKGEFATVGLQMNAEVVGKGKKETDKFESFNAYVIVSIYPNAKSLSEALRHSNDAAKVFYYSVDENGKVTPER